MKSLLFTEQTHRQTVAWGVGVGSKTPQTLHKANMHGSVQCSEICCNLIPLRKTPEMIQTYT